MQKNTMVTSVLQNDTFAMGFEGFTGGFGTGPYETIFRFRHWKVECASPRTSCCLAFSMVLEFMSRSYQFAML